MTSNLYLREPADANAARHEKTSIEVLRDAEAARSAEAARLMRKLGTSIADYFRRATTSEDVVPGGKVARQPDASGEGARAYV